MDAESPSECQPHPYGVFQKELTALINAHGIDNMLSIPDYILCNYVMDSFGALTNAKVSLLNHALGKVM